MARRVSEPLTPELAIIIKRMAADTDLAQHEIAAALHINQGRVSEVLNFKRFADANP